MGSQIGILLGDPKAIDLLGNPAGYGVAVTEHEISRPAVNVKRRG
jgi:hypothetical protein